MKKPANKYIIGVSLELIMSATNEDTALMQTNILFSQLKSIMGDVQNLKLGILPPDNKPCSYGHLNRTCDRTRCEVCERDDILQAMNEDDDDERSGRYE